MTIGSFSIYGGTCTLHGAYAGMHCPTCVTVLIPPVSPVPILPATWGWPTTAAAQPNNVKYLFPTNQTAPTPE